MLDFKNLYTQIQDLIDDASTQTLVTIKRVINNEYANICGMRPWSFNTIRETGVTSLQLPSNLNQIIRINVDNATDYRMSNQGDRYFDQTSNNFSFIDPIETPLATAADAVVTANSTSVTSAAASFSAEAGEYIRFGDNIGMYKIASVDDANTLTLTEAFRGDSATAVFYEVRPKGTRQIQFFDAAGTALTVATYTLHYSRQPLPLYNDYDSVLLPGQAEYLKYRVHKTMLREYKYDNDALGLLRDEQEVFDLMASLDPLPRPFQKPVDKRGQRIKFGRLR
jgi:hypothetical protein